MKKILILNCIALALSLSPLQAVNNLMSDNNSQEGIILKKLSLLDLKFKKREIQGLIVKNITSLVFNGFVSSFTLILFGQYIHEKLQKQPPRDYIPASMGIPSAFIGVSSLMLTIISGLDAIKDIKTYRHLKKKIANIKK